MMNNICRSDLLVAIKGIILGEVYLPAIALPQAR